MDAESQPAASTAASDAPAVEQETVEERDYTPSDDDGLTAIDDIADGPAVEIAEDDDEWGYDPAELVDQEVAVDAEDEQ